MAGMTAYLSILKVNVNSLNSPIKRYFSSNWIKKEDMTISCLQETHLTERKNHYIRINGSEDLPS
jgi:exonuclease III